MDDFIPAVVAVLLGGLLLAVAFTAGLEFRAGKIEHHCQNFGKFTIGGKLYECKEVGVAK